MRNPTLARELENRIDSMGFELVELEEAGNRQRPILRLSVDRPNSVPGSGITVDECARVSRALDDLSERYRLEVSSPGVERPLVRRRDWERFAGHEVALRGAEPLAGRARRIEGVLLGLAEAEAENGEEGGQAVLRLPDGEEVEVPLSEISHANLIYRWGNKTGPA